MPRPSSRIVWPPKGLFPQWMLHFLVTVGTASLLGSLLETMAVRRQNACPSPHGGKTEHLGGRGGVYPALIIMEDTFMEELIRRMEDAIRNSREQVEIFRNLRQQLHQALDRNKAIRASSSRQPEANRE
jgi:hypothetical protein